MLRRGAEGRLGAFLRCGAVCDLFRPEDFPALLAADRSSEKAAPLSLAWPKASLIRGCCFRDVAALALLLDGPASIAST